MSSLPRLRLTPEEYLEGERKASLKSEYMSGEIFAMAGASRAHNRIALNIATALNAQLRGRMCETYVSDMKVQAGPRLPFFYPDVVVVCGEPRFLDENGDVLLNPSLIVEVLSPSTEAFDRGEKSAYYRGMDSVREYLLVSQSHYHLERFVRQPGNPWLFSEADGLDAALLLDSIGCTVSLADVYDKAGVQTRDQEADSDREP